MRKRRVNRNGLTPREHQVAGLVARGLRNREVAQKLGLADGTVKTHVHHILQKLREKKRSALWILRQLGG
jgi:two-component system nitrate/nitrite response regulator NarP